MPGNMANLMKQAQKMQKQMEEQAKEMEEKSFTATAGGGAVEVTVSGKKEVQKIHPVRHLRRRQVGRLLLGGLLHHQYVSGYVRYVLR